MKKKILLVDGYNMIAFWKDTRQLFKKNQLDDARNILLRQLNNYAHFENINITCVFDAQYVPGMRQRYDQYKVEVIFTQEMRRRILILSVWQLSLIQDAISLKWLQVT